MAEMFDMSADRIGRLADKLDGLADQPPHAQRQVLAAVVLMTPSEAIPAAVAAVADSLRKAKEG